VDEGRDKRQKLGPRDHSWMLSLVVLRMSCKYNSPVSRLRVGLIQVLTMINSTFREAQSSDYAAIASWLPDASATLRWAGPKVHFPFTSAELEEQVQVAGGGSYVLVNQLDSVAFGQFWLLAPGAVHLGRLIVGPGHRRRGFGRVLCSQLISVAVRRTGARAVSLRVYRDNLVARNLYSSLGFQEVPAESDDQVLFLRCMVPGNTQ